jgi:hypothetical protein
MRQVFAPNGTCRFFYARKARATPKRKRRVMNPPPRNQTVDRD